MPCARAYDETRYVVELAGPGAVSMMPRPRWTLSPSHDPGRHDRGSYGEADIVLHRLKEAGIDYDDVVRQLEVEGLRNFEAWTELLESVTDQLAHAAHGVPARAGRL